MGKNRKHKSEKERKKLLEKKTKIITQKKKIQLPRKTNPLNRVSPFKRNEYYTLFIVFVCVCVCIYCDGQYNFYCRGVNTFLQALNIGAIKCVG